MAFAATRSQSNRASLGWWDGRFSSRMYTCVTLSCHGPKSLKVSSTCWICYMKNEGCSEGKRGPPSTNKIYQLYLCNNSLDIVLFQKIQTTTKKILWLSKLIFLASSIIFWGAFQPSGGYCVAAALSSTLSSFQNMIYFESSYCSQHKIK